MTSTSKSARSRAACGDAAGIAVVQAGLDLAPEPGLLGLAARHREARHVGAVALGEGDLAALGDQEGVVAGRLHAVLVLPQLAHLGGGLDVVAVAVEPEPLRVAHHRAGRDAEQVLVVGRVLAVDVVGVVGGDDRDREVGAELEQAVAHPLLDGQVVVHQLDEVVVACPGCPGSRRPPAGPWRSRRCAARSGSRRWGTRSCRSAPRRTRRGARGRRAAGSSSPPCWPGWRAGRGCACRRSTRPAASCGCRRRSR